MLEQEISGFLKKEGTSKGKRHKGKGEKKKIKREVGVNVYRESAVNLVYDMLSHLIFTCKNLPV